MVNFKLISGTRRAGYSMTNKSQRFKTMGCRDIIGTRVQSTICNIKINLTEKIIF